MSYAYSLGLDLTMATASERAARAFIMLGLIGVGVFLWNTPFAVPFRLLAVVGHETGHALATLAVGGQVQQLTIQSNEAGACLSLLPAGKGNAIIVYSAGYVGAALISLILLSLSWRLGLARAMLWVCAGWLTGVGFWLGGDVFTVGFCLGMAAFFIVSAMFLPRIVAEGLMLFVSVFLSLYALTDLLDLWRPATRTQSDAYLLSQITGVPAFAWSYAWILLAVLVLIQAFRFAVGPRGGRPLLAVVPARPAPKGS